MFIATTPTLNFSLPFDSNTIAAGYITLAQKNRNVIEKPLEEWTRSGTEVSVKLSQKETMLLNPDSNIEIQMRIRLNDGTALASRIFSATAERVLKDGEI